jgi:hypothetical protein
MMKKFLLSLVKRLGDLVLKLVSFKFVIAGVVTLVYLKDTATAGAFGFAIIGLMWIVVFGLREWSKARGIAIPGTKEP